MRLSLEGGSVTLPRSVVPKLRVAHEKCGRIPGKCWPFLVMGQSFVKKKVS